MTTIFTFTYYNLPYDISEYENNTGRKCKSLECSSLTMELWSKFLEYKFPTIKEALPEDIPEGHIGEFDGIPIIENNELADGVIKIN